MAVVNPNRKGESAAICRSFASGNCVLPLWSTADSVASGRPAVASGEEREETKCQVNPDGKERCHWGW
jgi:hypothetical protein